MQSTDQGLPELPFADEPAPTMRQAVTSLVRAKARCDRLARGGMEDRELAARCGLPAGEDGTSFFKEVLPFSGQWKPLGASDLCYVPLELTMGHSWRWYPEHVALEERLPLLERFLSCMDGTERAEVCWIVPLGLFLAHEGKNRIEFLREEGATYYPALTTPYDYPAAARLQLIQARGPHGDEWWAVLDDDSIEPLHYPDWALPVLTAYGVRTVQGWPASFPSYGSVRDEVARRGDRPRPLVGPPVSLKSLLAKEAKQEEIVSVSLMDLQDVRLKRHWKRALAALSVAFLVGGMAVQPTLHDFSPLSAGLGAMVLLGVMLFVEVLAVPRHRIDSENR